MESKFVSNETLAYLQAQAGSGNTQRIVALESNVENVVIFLKDYEAFIDSQMQEVESKISLQQAEIEEVERHFQAQNELIRKDAELTLARLEKGLRRIAVFSLSVALLTIALGLYVCLAK